MTDLQIEALENYFKPKGGNIPPTLIQVETEEFISNEWHYPSKGEYPKECENVLCCCKVVNAEFYSIGHTIIGGDTKIRWWASNRSEELNVYTWREIVPPKEIK